MLDFGGGSSPPFVGLKGAAVLQEYLGGSQRSMSQKLPGAAIMVGCVAKKMTSRIGRTQKNNGSKLSDSHWDYIGIFDLKSIDL